VLLAPSPLKHRRKTVAALKVIKEFGALNLSTQQRLPEI
jgi:hypothetical protein